jgi:hypothetical protein
MVSRLPSRSDYQDAVLRICRSFCSFVQMSFPLTLAVEQRDLRATGVIHLEQIKKLKTIVVRTLDPVGDGRRNGGRRAYFPVISSSAGSAIRRSNQVTLNT